MKTILYGDCHHLECDDIHSDECFKRYFTFYDISINDYVRYGFCNDYLRMQLKMQETESIFGNGCYASKSYLIKRKLDKFYEDIVLKRMYLEKDWRGDRTDGIYINVSERPWISLTLNYEYVCQKIIDIIETKGYIHRSDRFFDGFLDATEKRVNKLLKYKKYKSQHETCNTIIKRMKRYGLSEHHNPTDLIDLVSELFKLKINKYESSKQQEPVSIHL